MARLKKLSFPFKHPLKLHITALAGAIILMFSVFPVFPDPTEAPLLFKADLYLKGDKASGPVYYYSNEVLHSGDSVILRQLYHYPEGPLFALEEAVYNNGNFVSHRTFFPFLEEESLLLREGQRMTIQYTRGGRTRTRETAYEEGMVFGPTQQEFIIRNLPALIAEEPKDFGIPFPEFLTTARFRMRRVNGSPLEKPGTFVLEMRTRNILLSFLAKPIYFITDLNNGRILEIHGPTALKRRVGEKWEFFDAEIYFRY